ncbi:hypothetical protein COL93_29400 [Bacillus toyonensis]|uniref:Uncharacterized protein n=1 Tax=Bacillus toyonensis TaxID=155322 RepID=A0A2B5WTK7_9BACI|nr:hypothetical protein [Bacillus toyonensis]PGA87473.1 hypothetical protein COL93_29400 [Bacillus toyonensis]PHD56377.1 hypothetical protein COF40_29605 [Bacillus toyonensis]
MIENPMIIGNLHDSAIMNVMGHCESCKKEIYFGEEYLDFEGDCIHNSTACVKEYVVVHSTKKIAGE